ncbi:RES family NAD+ phosphorylase [Chryseobacterium sp. HSC-36S06]|uniref:RES family NAD+ phosphorylase n=1 Tax=Chryseobacterium sp. HSC-36S06 TaxID=2910970 RepID=UPI00209F8E74|nr:RES family NAD+ phosphorylase [Chryseobacterium sp. HSC-36S06]MCP2038340.1 hypothetical protein [Chryseobacterium sp. HSC-36S06]
MDRAQIISDLWTKFKFDIRFNNRYFADKEIRPLLDNFNMNRMFNDNTKIEFYRARIGKYINLNNTYLLAPPQGKSTAGRCNPDGISYLYLSLDKHTAVCEVRPSAGDIVSVARLNVDVSRIFSFRVYFQDESYRPYQDEESMILIKLIDNDLSSKVTKENRLNYLPLQYISEYVKNRGFEGFVYSSTVGPGMNLVLFDWENKVEILEKFEVEINNVNYEF